MPITVEYIRSNGINNLKGCKISEVKPSKTRTHPVFERVNWLDIPTNMTHKDTSRQWRLQEILSGYSSTSINYTI